MAEIKSIIHDLSIEALEQSNKIVGFAVVSDSGAIVYHTENFGLSDNTDFITEVINGASSFTVSGGNFNITEKTTDGIVGTSDKGMGYVILTPFQGGVLVSYAMPGADTPKLLPYLRNSATRLSGKV